MDIKGFINLRFGNFVPMIFTLQYVVAMVSFLRTLFTGIMVSVADLFVCLAIILDHTSLNVFQESHWTMCHGRYASVN